MTPLREATFVGCLPSSQPRGDAIVVGDNLQFLERQRQGLPRLSVRLRSAPATRRLTARAETSTTRHSKNSRRNDKALRQHSPTNHSMNCFVVHHSPPIRWSSPGKNRAGCLKSRRPYGPTPNPREIVGERVSNPAGTSNPWHTSVEVS